MKKTAIFPLSIITSLILMLAIREISARGIVIERSAGTRLLKIEAFKQQTGMDFYRGYFVGSNGASFTVDAVLIIDIVTFPDMDAFQEITNEESLAPLVSEKKELEEVASKIPQARSYLSEPLARIDATIRRFHSGERKINGEWKTPAQLAAAAAQQRAEEEKRAAEQKAEEEKRAAEQRAEEEKQRAERTRLIADFRDELQKILSHVARATNSFHEITDFGNMKQLPSPISESIQKLKDHADRLRQQVGPDVTSEECRQAMVMAEALQVIDEVARHIAAADASAASLQVSSFLQGNPQPSADEQKPLWTFLESIRTSCSRREADANTHIQRGQSLFSAGKTSDAIKEYQQAYRRFPNPQTAAKIKEIEDATLGL